MGTTEGRCPTCDQPTPWGMRWEIPQREARALRERDEARTRLDETAELLRRCASQHSDQELALLRDVMDLRDLLREAVDEIERMHGDLSTMTRECGPHWLAARLRAKATP